MMRGKERRGAAGIFAGGAAAWVVAVCLTLFGAGSARAAEMTANPRDTLVYKDGDRVQGKLVEQTATTIVFRADRFGELRVPAADAVVVRAERTGGEGVKVTGAAIAAAPAGGAAAGGAPAQGAAGTVAPAKTAASGTAPKPTAPAELAAKSARAEQERKADAEDEERVSLWDRFSPSVLTARVRNYFGPWSGRVTFSSEVVTDVAERNNSSYEAQIARKWKMDEVRFNARYDYSETGDVATTDLVKLWGQYRRDFSKALSAHYRPTVEWNRAARVRGVPNDYTLLQQELGAGFQIVTRPSRRVRVGVSQNLFNTWNSAPGVTDTARGVVSGFEEAEVTLPWRMSISQRGVWYPADEDSDGWENRVDLNKKLTETLSASLRHEIRRNNPDGTAQDYTRLKLLFGLDF